MSALPSSSAPGGDPAANRVAIVGGGAIGGFLAADLAKAGRAVSLCVRTPIRKLAVESGGVVETPQLDIITDPSALPATRWLLLAVKAQDVAGARAWLEAADKPGTTIVVVQNGIDHDQVRAYIRHATILPAVIYCSVEKKSPEHVLHHGYSRLIVEKGPAAEAMRAVFAGGRFEIAEDADFKTAAWRKLLSNVVGNPITALTLRRSSVLTEPAVAALGRSLLAEAMAVSAADGAHLTEADLERVSGVFTAGGLSGGGSSMLYDRLAGRPLEHAHITGAVVDRADRYGIPVPLNRAILALVSGASGHPPDGSH